MGAGGRQLKGATDCYLNPNHMKHSNFCPIGRRFGRSFLLVGNLVKIWPAVRDSVVNDTKHKLNIVRAKLDDGTTFVGVEVPGALRGHLMEQLGVSSR